jgi:hypothetical protein
MHHAPCPVHHAPCPIHHTLYSCTARTLMHCTYTHTPYSCTARTLSLYSHCTFTVLSLYTHALHLLMQVDPIPMDVQCGMRVQEVRTVYQQVCSTIHTVLIPHTLLCTALLCTERTILIPFVKIIVIRITSHRGRRGGSRAPSAGLRSRSCPRGWAKAAQKQQQEQEVPTDPTDLRAVTTRWRTVRGCGRSRVHRWVDGRGCSGVAVHCCRRRYST